MLEHIWEAAEFVGEWDGEGETGKPLHYKLYSVPAATIESDDDGLLLHGLDSGNVRRVESLWGEESCECDYDAFRVAAKSAPAELAALIQSILTA